MAKNKEVVNHGEKRGWKLGVDFPEWANTEVYGKTISAGYLFGDEKPKDAYWRVSTTVASRLDKPELASKFFDYSWKGSLKLASPVLSKTGLERGLPISCFGFDVADSIHDIGSKNLEMMLLAKHGGGVGIGINQIRPAGAKITGNGTSDGVVPFCKIYDSTILATNQGSVRRGAASVNINIEHDDFEEWLEIREPKGDVNRQSLNLHQCAVVGDKFMRRLTTGDTEARKKWGKLLQKRKATGEPYILFKGNTNKQNPAAYKDNALKVHMTNICSEITLHTDESHSFVCCLSSLNLAKYEEWKNTNIIHDAIWFLDGVLEEFIQRAKYRYGFENAVRSAEKGRALGLGVLVSAVVLLVAVRPLFQRLQGLEERRDTLLSLQRSAPTLERQLSQAETELRIAEEQQSLMVGLMAGRDEVQTFLALLNQQAMASGVQIKRYEPLKTPPVTEGNSRRNNRRSKAKKEPEKPQDPLQALGYRKSSVALGVSGPFEGVQTFLQRMEALELLV